MKNYNISWYSRASKHYKIKTAAGMSRILQHMQSGLPFGVISAFNSLDNTIGGKGRNLQRDKNLKTLLNTKDYSYIRMNGLYQIAIEKEDGSEEKLPVPEKTVFIPYIDEETLKEIAKTFNQESYIFGDDNKFYLKATKSGDIWLSGSTLKNWRIVSPEEAAAIKEGDPDAGKAYSDIGGKYWAFFDHKEEKPIFVPKAKEKSTEPYKLQNPPKDSKDVKPSPKKQEKPDPKDKE